MKVKSYKNLKNAFPVYKSLYFFCRYKIYLSPVHFRETSKIDGESCNVWTNLYRTFSINPATIHFFLMSGLLLKQWPTELTVTGGLDHLRLNFYGMHRTQITSDVIESNWCQIFTTNTSSDHLKPQLTKMPSQFKTFKRKSSQVSSHRSLERSCQSQLQVRNVVGC